MYATSNASYDEQWRHLTRGEIWFISPAGFLMRFVVNGCVINSSDTAMGWTYDIEAHPANLVSVHNIGEEGIKKLIEQLEKWLALFDTLSE